MSQAGAKGPASPQKPPPAKGATPAAPPVAPRGVAAPKVAPQPGPGRVAKSTMHGVPAPKSPSDGNLPPHVLAPGEATSPGIAPVAAPAAIPDAPPTGPLPAMPASAESQPSVVTAAQSGAAPLTAADVRLIVRTLLDDALEPLRQGLADAQRRAAELERRLASPAPVARAMAPAPPPTHAPAAVASYAAPAPPRDPIVVERDIAVDVDVRAFDGGRRRRRMIALFVVGLLVVFGGLFVLLAESYTHAHN